MNLLIPIEISSREMLYKTYLCHLLAISGFTCYLGNKRNIYYLMKKFDGYIYLDKGYHLGVSDEIYKTIKNNNGLIVNLDEEGAIDFPDGSTLRNRYTEALFEASERVFLWGDYQYGLVKDLLSDNKNVFVSGHPRFEMLKQSYHDLYLDDVRRLKKKYGYFILINTNLGFGNNIKGDDFIITHYGSRFVNIKDIIEFDKTKRDTYISLVNKLVQSTNENIVFRPHPEEEKSIYEDAFAKHKNVSVIYKGSVIPWLLASEVMIHPDCTTSIESLMLGKKAISHLPKNYDANLLTKLPLDISYRINNQDELVNFIKDKQYKINQTVDEDFQIIEKYFAFSTNTSQIIVDEITKVSLTIKPKNKSELSMKEKLKYKLSSIKYKLNRKLNNSKKVKLSKNKLAGFNFRNIKIIHTKIEKISNQNAKVSIEKISDDLIVFRRL